MQQNILILTDREESEVNSIDWEKVGVPVQEVSQLYQIVKERQIDLILVGGHRKALNQAVATRLRRPSGLTDIWKLVNDRFAAEVPAEYFDGAVPLDLGQQGIAKRVKQIIEDKHLLERYRIVGRSREMRALARNINRVAATDISALVVGPSGAGKELVARALHDDSTRKDKPFVAINCGALAEGVLESELFGHERGAFTGSVTKREGLFHKAEGGTVFLDEIGETNPNMQVKLLRVLEDGTYYPVGSSEPRRANVRIVAATNRDLARAIEDKKFREDLYFRISAVKLIVPPLMDRRGDVQPLLQHFWREYPVLDYSDSALNKLTRYDWPGNVRQLRNFASRMGALKPTGLVELEDVESFLKEQHTRAKHLPVSTGQTVEEAGQELIYRAIISLGNEIKMLRTLITSNLPSEADAGGHVSASTFEAGSTMEEMEKALIEQMLKETGGNRKETAKRLGIGERTLYRKLTKYDLR